MSQEKKYDVFISYRTVDTRLHASTLNFMINAKHPEWNVSFDHVNLYGEWPVELIRRVDNTKNVVVLVGENTFNFQSQQFEEQEVEFYRNLANAPIEEYKKQISELLLNEVHIDFLRLELNRAFRNNITVIPIVIYTEKIFSIDGLKLPKDLIALKSCQGLSYHNHVLNSSNIGDLLPGIELRMNRMGEISAGSLDKSKLSTELIPYHTPEEDLKRAFANLPKGQFQYGDCIYERNIEDLTVTLKKSLTIKCSYDIDPYIIQDNVRIPLTSIGQSAFEDNSFIEFVKIPDSITSIRENSFAGCSSLRFVDIPNSIASIECGSFSGCAFSSIIIPDSVTYIGEGAFYGCTSLAVITIPNSVVKIDTCAFAGCSSLTSIIIPCSVMSIEVDAFSDCTSLSSISVEEGNPIYDSRDNCNAIIETSSNQLILGCQNTVIPNGVTSIGHGAFSDCSSLTSIVIHDSVISIGESAFSGCSSLTSITIPNSVTSIGNWAFDGCKDLTSVTLPNSVTSIGYYAFAYCSGLTSITIPNSVTSIGKDAFYGCSGLTSIVVEKGNKTYDSRENCNAIIDTASNTLLVGCKNTFIPNSVTSIGEDAFYGCKGLTSITIPNSVTSIGNWAFKGCSGLTSITIPNSVKRIGDSSFIGCTFLNEIFYLGTHEQWNVINRCNVENCYSNKVIIHCVDRDVELETFSTNNSDISATPSSSSSLFNANHVDMKIRRVVANLSNEPFVNGDFIYERDKKTYSVRLKQPAWIATNEEKRISRIKKTFFVASYIELDNTPIPVSCIDKNAFKDDLYVEYIEISDGIISIENHAFSGCTALTDIIIPNSVKSIGEELFAGCLSLEYINLPNSVTSIRRKAFINCKGLTSITIPNGVTSIEQYVFSGCTSLTTIIIPSSVKSIAENAFWGCTSLSAILVDEGNPIYDSRDNCNAIIETSSNQLILGCQNTIIPNGVTRIGDGAFKNCSSLTSINIPDSVMNIGTEAFDGCSSLTSCVIPNGVTRIGNRAFKSCSSLTTIIIPNSVKSIAENAFWGCTSLSAILVDEGNPFYDSRDNCNAIIETSSNQLILGCQNTVIPNSVRCIRRLAFVGCSFLTSINIPNSVIKIESRAFAKCTSLISIIIPCSLKSIGRNAFHGCSSLATILVEEGNLVFDSRDNCNAIIRTATNQLIAGCKATTIPNSVTSIGGKAFDHCSSLTSITIPNSVTSIEDWAFDGCSGLTSITIPNSVTNIGNSAFKGCSGLTSITIPNSVTSIGFSAFYGCSALKSVKIPKTLTDIGKDAFPKHTKVIRY